MTSTPELVMFEFSHYNEKARWTLDYKRIVHRRRALLPGLHIPYVVMKTGQKSVPILRTSEGTITGSDRIVAFAENAGDGPALIPNDETERAEALRVQKWFDDEVGAPTRAALFVALFKAPHFARECMVGTRTGVAATAYRAAFGLLKHAIVMDAGATEKKNAAAVERIEEACAFIAERAGADGYLVGDCFSVADLAAAALLSPLGPPPECEIFMPNEELPSVAVEWFERWADQIATSWVRTMFKRHRASPTADAPKMATPGHE